MPQKFCQQKGVCRASLQMSKPGNLVKQNYYHFCPTHSLAKGLFHILAAALTELMSRNLPFAMNPEVETSDDTVCATRLQEASSYITAGLSLFLAHSVTLRISFGFRPGVSVLWFWAVVLHTAGVQALTLVRLKWLIHVSTARSSHFACL